MMQMMSLQTFDRTYPADLDSRLSRSPLLSAECLRRLAWSVFYSDSIIDGGRHGFHTIDENAYRLQLPCDETSFLANEPVRTEPLFPDTPSTVLPTHDQVPIGISGHLIRVAAARRRALHFAWRVSLREQPPSQLEAEAADLEATIEPVISSLPSRFRFNSNNIQVHRASMPAFLLLHLFRHNLYIVLGRARLMIYQGNPQRAHLISQARSSRIARALPIAGIVAEGVEARANFCPQVGVQAYVALESESEDL
jgi:hypothetical protein